MATLAETLIPPDGSELLRILGARASSAERTLVVVPIAGRPPGTGDLLIGLEAAQGLAPSVIVMRRDGYAAWSTIHRGTSLRQAYDAAEKAAPESLRMPLGELAGLLARDLTAATS